MFIIASTVLTLVVFSVIQFNLSLRITNYLHSNSLHSNSLANNDLGNEDTNAIQEESELDRSVWEISVNPTPKVTADIGEIDISSKELKLKKEERNESNSPSPPELKDELAKEPIVESNQDSSQVPTEVMDSEPSTESVQGSNSSLIEEIKSKSVEMPIVESTPEPTGQPNPEPRFEQTERPKKAVFNPVGIPFSKKSWFSLFRYYQKVKRNESTVSPDLLHSQTDSFAILPGDKKTQFLFIPNGCVNLYKRQIIILRNNPDQSSIKTNLRFPNVLQEVPLDSPIPGFESLPLFLSEATSVPYPILSSNLTWLFYTPKKEHENNDRECMNSLSFYLPLFFHSIHPLLPIDVARFLFSMIHSRNM